MSRNSKPETAGGWDVVLGLFDALLSVGASSMNGHSRQANPRKIISIGLDDKGQLRMKVGGVRRVNADLNFVPPDIIAAIEAVFIAKQATEEKRRQAEQLRQEYAEREQNIQRERTRLKADLWEILPEQYYGHEGLSLLDDGGVIYLVNESGERLEVVSEIGRSILNRHEELENQALTNAEIKTKIDRLELHVRHEPELNEVNLQDAFERFDEVIGRERPKLLAQYESSEADCLLIDGHLTIVVTEVYEEIVAMRPEIARAIRVLLECNGDVLPELLAAALAEAGAPAAMDQSPKPEAPETEPETE